MAKLERPVLGRHVQMGMLYDCRTDALLPGQTLWEPHVLQQDCVAGPYPETQSCVILSDSFNAKAAALGMDDSTKASIMSGLVECRGAAEFLNFRTSSNNQVRVALHHKELARYEQMTFRYAGEHNSQLVCAQGSATHVVTGILYGAHSFFVFDRHISHTDNTKNMQSSLQSMVKKISSLGIKAMLNTEEEKEIDHIQCTLLSDIATIPQPSNFNDAVQVYTNIQSSLGLNGENAVAVRMWLYPIANMSVPANLTPSTSSHIVSKTEKILEGLEGIQNTCNDLASQDVCGNFPPFAEKLGVLKTLVNDYKSSFQEKLKDIVPKVRGGELSEKAWMDILAANERSPYRLSGLLSWLKEKEKEMNLVKSYMKTFSSCTIIKTRNQLDELILDPGIRSVVCFSFPLISHEDKYLHLMSDYLHNPEESNFTSKGWSDNLALCRDMRALAKQFSDYALRNTEKDDIIFVVSGYDDGEEDSTVASSIFLYENGVRISNAFDPPGRPEEPGALDVSHETALLKWAHPKCGKSEVLYYLVRYRESKDNNQQKCTDWVELQAEQEKNQVLVVGLASFTSYEFQVFAVCKIGMSPPSGLVPFKTTPAYPPGPITKCKVSQTSITISWTQPAFSGSMKIKAYKVAYKAITGGHTGVSGDIMTEDDSNCMISIADLQPGTFYRFWVCAVYGNGKESAKSEAIDIETCPENKYAEVLSKKSQLIKPKNPSKGEPAIYKIPLYRGYFKPGDKYQTYQFGRDYRTGRKHSVIMVVGATGAGKSTLINGMINFITGVNWTDDFRFQLIEEEGEGRSKSQAHSQTQVITSYTIHQRNEFKLDYTLTIIDTPGFGDTRGIDRDRAIIEQIKDFFDNSKQHHIDHIDAIGFVAQASQARLTHTQRYIFDSVLSIFGKDIGHNILLLVTFADGKKPPLVDAIKEANIPCSDSFFKFNNSAIFTMETVPTAEPMAISKRPNDGATEENIDHMFWKMGIQSMKRFFENLNQLEPKSLSLTRDVLKERERLEIAVEGLGPQIHAGCCKLDELQKETSILAQYESTIQANKDFEYEVEVPKFKKIDIVGEYITNCSRCNYTCHYPCKIPNDDGKRKCAAMKDGSCTACPGECAWDVHFNMKYRFEYYTVMENRKYADLEGKYKDATGKKLTVEQIIKKLQEEFIDVQKGVLVLISDSNESLQRLEEIALKPNPLSTVEYIDLMIEAERREAKPNWMSRVKSLQDMRVKADIVGKVKKTDYDPFEGKYGQAQSLKKTRTAKPSVTGNQNKSENTNKLTSKVRRFIPFLN